MTHKPIGLLDYTTFKIRMNELENDEHIFSDLLGMEYCPNQKLRELIEKRILEISSSHKHFVEDENCCDCKIMRELQKLLEESKK